MILVRKNLPEWPEITKSLDLMSESWFSVLGEQGLCPFFVSLFVTRSHNSKSASFQLKTTIVNFSGLHRLFGLRRPQQARGAEG